MSGAVAFRREPATSPLVGALLSEYFSELAVRLPGGVEGAASLAVSPIEFSAPNGEFIVAFLGERSVGGGGIRRLDGVTAEVKHMWIDPAVRGRGVGRELLRSLEDSASRLGYRAVRLDTSDHLDEALGLYRSSGYEEISAYNDNRFAAHWFEKRLIAEV
jgi:ribosomal protein S18 acetylase RimI-like enzyme